MTRNWQLILLGIVTLLFLNTVSVILFKHYFSTSALSMILSFSFGAATGHIISKTIIQQLDFHG